MNVRRPLRRARTAQTSRAHWLAFGSVALAGCTGSVAAAPLDGGATVQHDAATAAPEAGALDGGEHEAGAVAEAGPPEDAGLVVQDDAGVACASRSGYFDCAGNVCDRSIQACYQGQCVWYGELYTYQMPDTGPCGPCPTCECLQPGMVNGCHCEQDVEGTITVSCAGCYGAPPARLERLV